MRVSTSTGKAGIGKVIVDGRDVGEFYYSEADSKWIILMFHNGVQQLTAKSREDVQTKARQFWEKNG